MHAEEPASMSGGGGFAQLLQEAARLKTAQMASERKKYDAWPEYYQASLFPGEEVEGARAMGRPGERLEAARSMRDQGREKLSAGDVHGGVACLSRALAVFRYCCMSDMKDFRTKGIRDEALEEVDDVINEGERRLAVECYSELAKAYLQEGRRCLAVRACDDALALAPTHTTALVTRARARSSSLSASSAELKAALRDLFTAIKQPPTEGDEQEDREQLRQEYKRLWQEVVEGERKSKATFKGMFERGSICQDDTQDDDDKQQLTSNQAKPSSSSSSQPPPPRRSKKRPPPGRQGCTGLATPPPPIRPLPPGLLRGGVQWEEDEEEEDFPPSSQKPPSASPEKEQGAGGGSGGRMTLGAFKEQVTRLEALAQQHEAEERYEEAEEVRRTIEDCQSWLSLHEERREAERREAAAKFGLDLDDPRVVACLERLARGEELGQEEEELLLSGAMQHDDEDGLGDRGLVHVCWGMVVALVLLFTLLAFLSEGDGAGQQGSSYSWRQTTPLPASHSVGRVEDEFGDML